MTHGESNSQATGTHAALLAPKHVTLWRHTDGSSHHRRQVVDSLSLPDYDPATTVVMFPEAKDTPVLTSTSSLPEAVTKVVVLEGTWRKARHLLNHPKLRGLPRMQLPLTSRTIFWRRGSGTFKGALEEGVCTIEAVYLTCRVLEPDRCFDDLLWYYLFVRDIVQKQGAYSTRQKMLTRDQLHPGMLLEEGPVSEDE